PRRSPHDRGCLAGAAAPLGPVVAMQVDERLEVGDRPERAAVDRDGPLTLGAHMPGLGHRSAPLLGSASALTSTRATASSTAGSVICSGRPCAAQLRLTRSAAACSTC